MKHLMTKFFPKKTPREVAPELPVGVLIVDIGTEIVKALVCRVDSQAGVMRICGVGKQKQRLGDMYNGGIIDIENVMVNVRRAVAEAEQQAKMQTHQVVLGIAGELVKGTTITVEYERERPDDTITLSELRNLVHKVQWRAYEKARRELTFETGYSEVEVKLVHSSLVDIRIDSYRVANPIGFKGRHVQVGIFNAFAPLVHFDSLVAIAEGLGRELLSVIVEPYAVSRCFAMEDGGDMSAIFIDIGGGSTDVALVQNGGIVGTKMYGIGGRVFTKRISKHFHVPFLEAEKMKLEYSARKLTGLTHNKVEKIIAGDVATWLEGLTFALEGFTQVDRLPGRIYISGGGSLLPDILGAMSSTPWHEHLHFVSKPQVAPLKPEHVTRVVDETGTVKNQQDITPMALASIAYDLTGEERILGKVLRQVTRVIST